MNEQDRESGPDRGSGRSRFGALHTRTFEMELLISGAVVYGLLQLPARVTRLSDVLQAGLAGNLRRFAIVGEVYVLLVLYALLAAFLLHLAMRAFWIGLVGLESVFPDGIRWDRVKAGPLTVERWRTAVGSLAQTVDRVDDLCSLVFSFGFLIVLTFAYSVVTLALAGVVGFGASRLVLGGTHALLLTMVAYFSFAVLQLLTLSADQKLRDRLAEGSRARRALGLLVNFTFVTSPMRWTGPVQLTLGSNLSGARVSVATTLLVTTFGVLVVGLTVVGKLGVTLDSLTYFPGNLQSEGVDPRHYRDQRPPDFVDPRFPSIQSDTVEGAYLKLLIPYSPRHHNHLIESACPGVAPLRPAGFGVGGGRDLDSTSVRAAAGCLGSLFEIRLDGNPLVDPHFDFTRDSGSGLAAVVTYLPAADLERGRHELVVMMPDTPGDKILAREPGEPARHLIPFWR